MCGYVGMMSGLDLPVTQDYCNRSLAWEPADGLQWGWWVASLSLSTMTVMMATAMAMAVVTMMVVATTPSHG